jgi:hypothetical protein
MMKLSEISDWIGTNTTQAVAERIGELEADRDALIGYACVLESMLRQQDIKLPPKPSILTDERVSDR